MSRDKGVDLPVESGEEEDGDSWWEDEDLLEDPLEVPGEEEEEEVEATMAKDEVWEVEDLLEDPDEAAGIDPSWDERTVDEDPGYEDVGDWDDLLEDPDEVLPAPEPVADLEIEEEEDDEDDTTEPSWHSPLIQRDEAEELEPLVVSWRPITKLLLHDGLRMPATIDLSEARSWLVCNWSDGERGHVVLQLETGEIQLLRGADAETVVLSLDVEGRRVDALLSLRPTDGPARLVLGRALLAQHRFLVDPA